MYINYAIWGRRCYRRRTVAARSKSPTCPEDNRWQLKLTIVTEENASNSPNPIIPRRNSRNQDLDAMMMPCLCHVLRP
jgi:hypothetical protein